MGERKRKRHSRGKGGKSKSRRTVERFERESSLAALEKLSIALNTCEKKNLHVKLRHGIIFSDIAIILPIEDKWVVRMLTRP